MAYIDQDSSCDSSLNPDPAQIALHSYVKRGNATFCLKFLVPVQCPG